MSLPFGYNGSHFFRAEVFLLISSQNGYNIAVSVGVIYLNPFSYEICQKLSDNFIGANRCF